MAKADNAAKAGAVEAVQEPASMVLECPQCESKKAVLVEHVKDVPHFGKVLISSLRCDKCDFKLNDVICTDVNDAVAFSADIKEPKDIETKLIKSSSGTVKIAKLGVVIEPGPTAEGYITNIEGLLDRVESVVKSVIDSKEDGEADEKKLARRELRRIQDAKKPLEPYTVLVEDPFGNSALVGQNVKKIKLSADEVSRLKKNIEVLEL